MLKIDSKNYLELSSLKQKTQNFVAIHILCENWTKLFLLCCNVCVVCIIVVVVIVSIIVVSDHGVKGKKTGKHLQASFCSLLFPAPPLCSCPLYCLLVSLSSHSQAEKQKGYVTWSTWWSHLPPSCTRAVCSNYPKWILPLRSLPWGTVSAASSHCQFCESTFPNLESEKEDKYQKSTFLFLQWN